MATDITSIKRKYLRDLALVTPRFVKELRGKKIQKNFLQFRMVGTKPKKKPNIPNDANSEFLANRAMGDWAERKIASLVNKTKNVKAFQLGVTSRLIAGTPEFKSDYLGMLENTRIEGKRPDYLVYPKNFAVPLVLAKLSKSQLKRTVRKAIGAMEVRSSKFAAIRYIKARKGQKQRGRRITGKETPSFTMKMEDVKIVHRWIRHHSVPLVYVQVFFDSVFAINFLTLMKAVVEGRYRINKSAKSQEKTTIMVPLTVGTKIAEMRKEPGFTLKLRVSELGRYDAYVKPISGSYNLNLDALIQCLHTWDFKESSVDSLLS